MYIKLGSTVLNRIKQVPDDFIVLSQVVNSSMSYERPVIVRTIEELDIWFGREFDDYNYFCELIKAGNSLYLSRPVSNQTSTEGLVNYIDYNEFDKIELGNLIEFENLKEKEEDRVYSISGIEYIYLGGELMPISDLPQNQFPNNSVSLNNRDTLIILDNEGKRYISPKYIKDITGKEEDRFYSRDFLLKVMEDTLDYEKISKNYQTLAFDLKFGNNFLSDIPEGDFQYISIYGYFDENKLSRKIYIIGNKGYTTTQKYRDFIKGLVPQKEYESISINNTKESFLKSIFEDNGYLVEMKDQDNALVIFPEPINASYDTDLCGFSITPNQEETYGILNHRKNGGLVSFVSKTVGSVSQEKDGKIKVKIECSLVDYYRVTISRFGYSEIFEGPLVGKDRIDYKISSTSALVYCNLGSETTSLPIGEWYLSGGLVEEYQEKDYWKALDSLVNSPDMVFFDYLLIPDMKKYTGRDEIDWNNPYRKLLEMTVDIDCQILIQCNDNWVEEEILDTFPKKPKKKTRYIIGDKKYIYNNSNYIDITEDNRFLGCNDFYMNYTGDKDNRLIYFYRPMKIFGEIRPGYYLYLSDLLGYDRYSPEIKDILYNGPTIENSFYEDSEIISLLEDRKCNYLIENNHIYYYKKYQNGKSYNTTGWMRFCLGKIKRELSKNKWLILKTKDPGKIEKSIIEILNKISSKFSIIRSIRIKDFSISYKDKTIDLTIDTSISDLIENNISIDLTLNYNS